jgi:ABC-2 type transport system ATP-binding protein
MEVLHVSSIGRIYTLIVRGTAAEVKNRLATLGPIFMEAIPLNLEEIFIYELGGDDYAVQELVL